MAPAPAGCRVGSPLSSSAVLFPTVQFALFFPVVLVISWALMQRQALWKPFIIIASYVFYGYADWRFCVLLAGITVGNQCAAQLIARTSRASAHGRGSWGWR